MNEKYVCETHISGTTYGVEAYLPPEAAKVLMDKPAAIGLDFVEMPNKCGRPIWCDVGSKTLIGYAKLPRAVSKALTEGAILTMSICGGKTGWANRLKDAA